MSEKNSIARPYAKALFDIAIGENQLASWAEILEDVALITQDPQMIALLKCPQFSIEETLDLIFGMLPVLSTTQKEAIRFIAESKRLLFMTEIVSLYQMLKREKECVMDVTITSTVDLKGSAFAKKIETVLKERFKQDVLLNFEIDEGVIGGALIKAGDFEIDGTVRGRLAQLQDVLGI